MYTGYRELYRNNKIDSPNKRGEILQYNYGVKYTGHLNPNGTMIFR